MPDFDSAEVDPSVTDDEIEKALSDHAVAPFSPASEQDVIDSGAPSRGLVAVIPRTPTQGLAELAVMRRNDTPIGGVGLCWQHVRRDCWGVEALWPTAQEGGIHGQPIHRFKAFKDAPRGMTIIYENDNVWHVTVALGGGLNDTSDLHENGFSGVATMARTFDWCGAHAWYGIETVNGFDVWPTHAKPKPKPKVFTLAERLTIVEHRIADMHDSDHPKRAARFELWADELRARIKARK